MWGARELTDRQESGRTRRRACRRPAGAYSKGGATPGGEVEQPGTATATLNDLNDRRTRKTARVLAELDFDVPRFPPGRESIRLASGLPDVALIDSSLPAHGAAG